jgi:hypothetical protein
MKKLTVGLVAFCILLASCSMSKDTELAAAQIPAFHKELDAGAFQHLYASSSSDLQKAATEADFVKLLDAVNRKLGKVKTSTQKTWNVASTTSGTFVTLVQTTQFERGPGDEQFVYRIDNGMAKLAGYHINSIALVSQ